MSIRVTAWLPILLLCLPAISLARVVSGDNVIINQPVAGDLYAMGGDVEIQAPVAGDAVAAGGNVRVSGNIRDDLIVAGGDVAVSGQIGDDLRAAGGNVKLTGSVMGHAMIAGGTVRLGRASVIGDWAWISAARAVVGGSIGGNLRVAADSLVFTGQVDGDVELIGNDIRIGDGALIDGDLIWRSGNEPVVSSNAIINGEIRQGEPPEYRPSGGDGGGWIFGWLAVSIAAGLLYTLFRRGSELLVDGVETAPGWCLLTGLLVFAATPVVTILLMVTVIGGLAAAVLFLAYLLAILVGALAGIVSIAVLALERFGRTAVPSTGMVWVGILGATLALNLTKFVPLLGVLAPVLVIFVGLGSLSRAAYAAVRN